METPYRIEDNHQTEEELLREITQLRYRVAELEEQLSNQASTLSRCQTAPLHPADLSSNYQTERQARAAAESANRIKDEFLAVLSHELRSPLNPILGWTQMLRSYRLGPEMTDRALEAIERNAKLQVQLIEDLLDVSQILQGKLKLNVTSVDLVDVIEAAIETVRHAVHSKSIDLQFAQEKLDDSVGQDRIQVVGDATRLQQVVWNLIANAVKFTPPQGKVWISLERVKADRVPQPFTPAQSHAIAPTDYVQITVCDTGKGIDPIFLPHIFEYFYQVDSTITRQFGGLGLGLTIVRHLVELHGGSVQVESPGEGQGATFWVRLPLLQNSQPLPVAQTKPTIPTTLETVLRNKRILVVDDDADMREFVGFALRQAGAEVALASSVGEVLIQLSRFKPDVLISDIGMPDVDGCQLLRQIRSLMPELGGQVPAIALTTYAGEYQQQQILSAGFQCHVAKPIEPALLIKMVASLPSSAAQLNES